MIKSLKELQSIMLNEAYKINDPIFRRPWLLTSPGCSDDKIALLLRKIRDFPKNYIKIIKEYSVNGVIIGDFELSPSSFTDNDTVLGLLRVLDDPFFPSDFMKKHKLYKIGSYNTDLICITSGTEKFAKGEVLLIEEGFDIYNPNDSQINPVAKDFEQFMIIAANLSLEGVNNDENNHANKQQEFLECLRKLEVHEKYHETWMKYL